LKLNTQNDGFNKKIHAYNSVINVSTINVVTDIELSPDENFLPAINFCCKHKKR
jgi:hypothetical protein